MVEDVLLAVSGLEYLAAVAGTVEAVALVAVQDGRGKAFGHAVAVAVEEVVGQALCPANLQLVGVVAEEARTDKEVPVFAVPVQVGAFEDLRAVGALLHLQSGHVYVSGFRLASKSVLRQFHAVYAAHAAEEEPHLACLWVCDDFRVDGVVDARLCAARDDAHVAELPGGELLQHAYFAVLGTVVEGEVEVTLACDGCHVGSPEALGHGLHRAPRADVDGRHARHLPVEEVVAHDGAPGVGRQTVVASVITPPDGRVGPVALPYGVRHVPAVFLRGCLCLCRARPEHQKH